MPTREGNISVLRVMLDKLPKGEIIELSITLISTICDEEKDLTDITHTVVTYVQTNEILAGRSNLKDYQEPHREELFGSLLSRVLGDSHEGRELTDDVASEVYEDFRSSGLSFNEWWIKRNSRL